MSSEVIKEEDVRVGMLEPGKSKLGVEYEDVPTNMGNIYVFFFTPPLQLYF